MTEELITFKIAKLAKDKGFSVGTNGCLVHYKTENKHPEDGTSGPFGWEKDEMTYDGSFIINGRKDLGDLSNEFYDCYELPTQSLLQKWLREEHKIYAYIDWHDCSSVLFKDGLPEYVEVFKHMDLEKLLQKALKLIK